MDMYRESLVFGRRLHAVRRSRGLTQEQLAELAELNTRTIQKIEAGDINILLTTLVKLQKALKCRMDELFPETTGRGNSTSGPLDR